MIQITEYLEANYIKTIGKIEGILHSFDPEGVSKYSSTEYEGYAVKIYNISEEFEKMSREEFREKVKEIIRVNKKCIKRLIQVLGVGIYYH